MVKTLFAGMAYVLLPIYDRSSAHSQDVTSKHIKSMHVRLRYVVFTKAVASFVTNICIKGNVFIFILSDVSKF